MLVYLPFHILFTHFYIIFRCKYTHFSNTEHYKITHFYANNKQTPNKQAIPSADYPPEAAEKPSAHNIETILCFSLAGDDENSLPKRQESSESDEHGEDS